MAFEQFSGFYAGTFQGREAGSWMADFARLGVKMFGAGTPSVGTIEGEGKHEWLIQGGQLLYSSDGAGLSVIPFKKPFPRAVLVVMAMTNQGGVNNYGATLSNFTVAGPPNVSGGTIFYFALGC